MTPALGTRRQLVVFLIALAVFVTLFVRWRSAPAAPGPQSSAAAGRPDADAPDAQSAKPRARSAEKTPSIDSVYVVDPKDLDPLLQHAPGAPSRNIFDLRAPTPVPPPTPTPAPPPPPAPGSPDYIGPMPPPPPTPTPVPPAINFKFVGTFGPKDNPVGVFVQNDQIVNAHAGDVIFDRFIVRKIGYESVEIGYVGRGQNEFARLAMAP